MSHLQMNPSEDPAKKNVPEYDPNEVGNFAEETPFLYISPDLPPEIASQFLEEVYEFEKAWSEAKTTTVYELIGQPFFHHEEELEDAVLKEELQRMINLLQNKQMVIDIPDGVTQRKVYRYITEFLLGYEIEDLRIEGLTTHFIYNENEEMTD